MTVAEQLRPGTPADAVDGVTPRFVAEPTTGAACAAVLAAAAVARHATVIRGGGTKMGWGRPVEAVDLAVSTTGLGDLLVHRDGDLTATVGAGVPVITTWNVVPGVFSGNVAVLTLVMIGESSMVSVKFCTLLLPTLLSAVNVNA